MSKYPFIERLGLRVFKHFNYGWSYSEPNSAGGCGSSSVGPREVVSVDELEKLLSSAPVVYAYCIKSEKPAYWGPKEGGSDYEDTHTALMIGVQPIRKETATDEKLEVMRAMINFLTRSYPLMSFPEEEKYRADLAERAKKLLEGK